MKTNLQFTYEEMVDLIAYTLRAIGYVKDSEGYSLNIQLRTCHGRSPEIIGLKIELEDD